MNNPYATALEFLVDAGVTQGYSDDPYNRFEGIALFQHPEESRHPERSKAQSTDLGDKKTSEIPPRPSVGRNDDTGKGETVKTVPLQSHIDTVNQAKEIAAACTSLDDLRTAIQNFDGLNIKKTATNLVFADGNPTAKIMVIGEAPGADEDRQGVPFVGASGQLLDKIFACINLSRTNEDADKSIYISNILNWRPPGNRTPTKEEMEIAHPFIQKHIDLINPDMLVLCGGVAAQTLLQSKESISRLRGRIHDYNETTKAIATYHPAFLLRTPIQKKKVWEDMLTLQEVMGG